MKEILIRKKGDENIAGEYIINDEESQLSFRMRELLNYKIDFLFTKEKKLEKELENTKKRLSEFRTLYKSEVEYYTELLKNNKILLQYDSHEEKEKQI